MKSIAVEISFPADVWRCWLCRNLNGTDELCYTAPGPFQLPVCVLCVRKTLRGDAVQEDQ